MHPVCVESVMRQVIWRTLVDFWCDCSLWIGQASVRQEQRQFERSIREHGVLWLTDRRYAVPVPSQRRRTATR